MPVETRIKANFTEVENALARIQARFGDLRPAMEIVGETVLASILQNFEAGGRPTRWEPLSDVTRAIRQAQKKWPGRILERRGVSGGLKGSINYQASSNDVVFTANKKYAALQQFGARRGEFGTVTAQVKAHMRRLKSGKQAQVKAHTRKQVVPWGDIPARPFMMVQDEDWEEIRLALGDYFFGGN